MVSQFVTLEEIFCVLPDFHYPSTGDTLNFLRELSTPTTSSTVLSLVPVTQSQCAVEMKLSPTLVAKLVFPLTVEQKELYHWPKSLLHG
jgi:hypothetical protein